MFDKSVIIRRIENTFRNISIINTAYLQALDKQYTNMISGGNNGNARISDPTANTALAAIEPKTIKSVMISYTNQKGEHHSYEVHNPGSWLKLYGFVEEQVSKDYFQREIFKGRYLKNETNIATSIRLGISRKTYFNVRNEIMLLAVAGACQLNLVKIM